VPKATVRRRGVARTIRKAPHHLAGLCHARGGATRSARAFLFPFYITSSKKRLRPSRTLQVVDLTV
jgi:hypothetical protein